MTKPRNTQPNTGFMDSLFASLGASGALDAARPEDATSENLPGSGEAGNGETATEAIVARDLRDARLPTKGGRKGRSATSAAAKQRKASTSSGTDAAPSAASPEGAITISALSTHILGLFERDELLRHVWVMGEVSNWKLAGNGHAFFSLKDAGATIAAVMWRSAIVSHGWLPRDGDQVLAHGSVSLYAERGSYQLYVKQIRPAGRGQLFVAFEALKARLDAEGLFAPERKRLLPARVRRIGVITSRDGAALRDILRVLSTRWPLLDVLLFPALVQGGESPAQVCAALANANRYSATVEPLDLILLARGGGSIEDLWGFNDEQVARAIAASALPVVTGIGHETDFTIADFVADVRAATPSAAAMTASPDKAEMLAQLEAAHEELAADAWDLLDDERRHLAQRSLRLSSIHPERALGRQRQQLNDRTRRLEAQMQRRLERLTGRVDAAGRRLGALSPLAVLERGYSIVQRKSGQVVLGPEMVEAGEELTVRAAHGTYAVTAAQAGDRAPAE